MNFAKKKHLFAFYKTCGTGIETYCRKQYSRTDRQQQDKNNGKKRFCLSSLILQYNHYCNLSQKTHIFAFKKNMGNWQQNVLNSTAEQTDNQKNQCENFFSSVSVIPLSKYKYKYYKYTSIIKLLAQNTPTSHKTKKAFNTQKTDET